MSLPTGRFEAANPGPVLFKDEFENYPADHMVVRITTIANSTDIQNVSGDIFYDRGRRVVSFYGSLEGGLRPDGDAVEGQPVFLIKNERTQFDDVSFRVEPDGGGGIRLSFRGGNGSSAVRLAFVGRELHTLSIEVHGLAGVDPPEKAAVVDAMQDAMGRAGIACQVHYDTGFEANTGLGDALRVDELHAAMLRLTTPQTHARPMEWWAHCLFADRFSSPRYPSGDDDVVGVMYDVSTGRDLSHPGSPPRQGFAVFLGSARFRQLGPSAAGEWRRKAEWQRELRFTLMHEIGHVLNLPHCFPDRAGSCSWMNYPYEYNAGSSQFWAELEEKPEFDALELMFLRHAPFLNVAPGGNSYGEVLRDFRLNEPFSGTEIALVSARADGSAKRRRPSALRATIAPLKRIYAFGEPVFLKFELENTGKRPVRYTRAFDPSDSTIIVRVTGPDGKARVIEPIMALCRRHGKPSLQSGERMSFDGIFAACDARGPLFLEPGIYRIDARYDGATGGTLVAGPGHLRVLAPNRAEEYFAYRLWDDPMLMRALYLRQPLLARESWQELVDVYAPALAADPQNTTRGYLAYISALGWQRAFRPFRRENAFPANPRKAAAHVPAVGFAGLPASVARRCADILEHAPAPAGKSAATRRPRKT